MHLPTPAPVILACLALRALAADAPATPEPPAEWIDPDTGHRVVRLSKEPGSASLYFHQNAYSPDGRKLVITTPRGVSTIDLATRAIDSVVEGRVNVIVVGRKSGDVYYSKRVEKNGAGEQWIYATNLDTKTTREIGRVPRGGVSSLNADETLMLGQYSEGDDGERPPGERGSAGSSAGQPAAAGASPTFQARYEAKWPDGTPMAYADAKDLALHNRLLEIRKGPPQVIFTFNTGTGEVKEVHRAREWLGHLQFSPTDPGQIMFCHEGTWHEVDRVWLVRTDGTGLQNIHQRTMNMEIAGHEFFSADGKTVWYDLQTPRGEDFWLGGFEIATGRRTRYHLQRDEWSVHFNVSPDGTLFAGDGGDEQMVAHARDGEWIHLFRPERIPDVAGVSNPNAGSLINPGVFRSERLVKMLDHEYRLEPNVSFSPDMKWIIFRSNMHGATHVYAVEIARAK